MIDGGRLAIYYGIVSPLNTCQDAGVLPQSRSQLARDSKEVRSEHARSMSDSAPQVHPFSFSLFLRPERVRADKIKNPAWHCIARK